MTVIHDVDLSALYESLILDYQERRNSRQWSTKGKIYVSTLVGTKCDRQIRYIFEGHEGDTISLWPGLENQVGTVIHDIIQEAFGNKGGLAEIEKKISITVEDVKINMKVDGVFANGNILELKTLGPKDYDIKQPREKDLEQANFYLGIMGSNSAIITYLKRDNGQHIKSFQIEFDRERYKKLLLRISNIIKNRKIKVNRFNCRFCKFKKRCSDDDHKQGKISHTK